MAADFESAFQVVWRQWNKAHKTVMEAILNLVFNYESKMKTYKDLAFLLPFWKNKSKIYSSKTENESKE